MNRFTYSSNVHNRPENNFQSFERPDDFFLFNQLSLSIEPVFMIQYLLKVTQTKTIDLSL
ncbi:MAG: hypothetical protein JNJ86_14960 [Chitinophagaceae bacterium]|nr:hypothetical protein [Chitinophagaceae bacterium]